MAHGDGGASRRYHGSYICAEVGTARIVVYSFLKFVQRKGHPSDPTEFMQVSRSHISDVFDHGGDVAAIPGLR